MAPTAMYLPTYIETILDRRICTKEASFEEGHYMTTTRHTFAAYNI
jgi:hypothetical protein